MTELKITIKAQDSATGTVEGLGDTFEGVFDEIADDLKALKGTFEQVGEDITKTFEEVGEDLQKSMSKSVVGGGIPGLGPIASVITGGLPMIGGILKGAMSGIVGIVGSALSGVLSVVTGIFSTAFSAAVAVGKTILSGIGAVVSGAFRGLGAVLDTVLLGPFRIVFSKITGLIGAVGIGWGAKLASDFQDSLTVAFSLIPDKMTPELRKSLQRSMEDLRAETGAGGVVIGTALYNAISAGAKDMPKPLTEAAIKFAVLGGEVGTAEMALSLFAQTANTLKKPLTEATDIAEMYQKTIQEGILRPSDLAMQMGYVLPFVQSLNLEFTDLIGIIAQASKTFRPQQLFTGLAGVLSRVLDPSSVKAMKEELGISLYDMKGEFIGLKAMLEELSQAEISDEALKKIFPDIRAKKFFLAMKEQVDEMNTTIGLIEEYPGSIARSWEERGRSVNLAMSRVLGGMANLFSTTFDMIDDDIVRVMGHIQDDLSGAVDWLRKFADDGGWERIKKGAGLVWDALTDWLPTFEEIKKGFNIVLTEGVAAFNTVKQEAKALKGIFTDLFAGEDIDFTQSILVTGFQIAFEYAKKYAAEAFDYIRKQASTIMDSELARSIGDRFSALGDIIKLKMFLKWEEIKLDAARSFAKIPETLYALIGEPDPFLKKILGWPSPEELSTQIDSTYAQMKASMKMFEGLSMVGLEGRITAPLPIGGMGFDDATLKELEARMADLLARPRAGAAEGAEAVKAAVVGAAEKLVESIDEATQVQADQSASTAEALNLGTSIYQSLLESEKASKDEAISSIHGLTAAQRQHVDIQGELNEALVDEMKETQAALHAANQKIKYLQDALGGL